MPALTRAAFVFCASDRERDEVARFRTAPCRVIPLGVGAPVVGSFQSAERDQRRILFLGRLTEKKGVDILLAALGLLRDRGCEFDAQIVGPADGDLRERYQAIVEGAGLGDRVQLLPFADGEAKERLFAASGVFVLPSEDENFGIAPAEALVHGHPIVVTPGVSHAPSVRSHGLGLVPDRTPVAVAEALRSIIELRVEEWEAMSRRAREFALQSYDWGRTASAVVGAFEDQPSLVRHWPENGCRVAAVRGRNAAPASVREGCTWSKTGSARGEFALDSSSSSWAH